MELLLINKSAKLYQTYPYHSHKNWEIILCMDGVGEALIAGRVYPFQHGTIFCIPPGVPHKKTAAEGYNDGCIFLNGFAPLTTGVTVCQDDGAGSFARLFDLTCEMFLKNGPNTQGITQALMEAMYQLLVRLCGDKRQRNPAVERFEKLMLENISNPDFDLTRALDYVGYSRNHFRSLFKAYTGMTPVDYLRYLRIEYAKQTMRRSRGMLSVAEIARMAGFSEPYYFSQVFSRHEGMSPRAFLKALEQTDSVSLVFEPAPDTEDFSADCYTRWHDLVQEKN